MRSYTNQSGIQVEVSEAHLQTAVRIKKELQNAVPSRRCNWKTLVDLMAQEGFDDAENSESYRQMIKFYQKSIGELPDGKKHADLVSGGKLASIKEAVGEIAYEKRSNQIVLRELNKVKRDVIDSVLIIEEIGRAFAGFEAYTPDIPKTVASKTERSMLVLPSDWHIGYMNKEYNHEVAKMRVNRYADKVIEYATIFKVNQFHLIHLGDIIEHLYMHKNTQSFNAEFTMAEQIVEAVKLLYLLVTKLAKHGNVVFHGVVQGNHGRMSAKGETADKDCAEYVVHEAVKMLISANDNDRIKIDDVEYSVVSSMTTIHNKRVKATHGDFEGQNDRDKIQKHISLENEIIDILALGHFHNYQVKSENHGRLVYGSGCLQGSTHYGEKLKYDSPASQGVVVLSEDEVIPINIPLEG